MCVCVCVCLWVQISKGLIWNPLELKLWMVLSCLTWVLKTKARSSGRSASDLDSWAPCLPDLPNGGWMMPWSCLKASYSCLEVSSPFPTLHPLTLLPRSQQNGNGGENKRKTRKTKAIKTKGYGTKTQREIWVCVGMRVCSQINYKMIYWAHVEMQKKWKFKCAHGPWGKIVSSFSHITRYMQIPIRRGTIWINPGLSDGNASSTTREEWERVAGWALHMSEDSGCYLYSQCHLSFNSHFQLLRSISSLWKDLNSACSDHLFLCKIISVYLALKITWVL